MADVAVETRERPILFSGPMVRAILDGRKTQTRRVVTAHTSDIGRELWKLLDWSRVHVDPGLGAGAYLKVGGPDDTLHRVRCRWRIGDLLWVRETWQYADWTEDGEPYVRYEADGARVGYFGSDVPDEWADRVGAEWERLSTPENYAIDNRAADRRWRPSIFMPRWASRLTLEITDVRVERLQAITVSDCEDEGVQPLFSPGHDCDIDGNLWAPGERKCRDAYRALWDAINAARGFGWDANPWVWVIQFARVAARE